MGTQLQLGIISTIVLFHSAHCLESGDDHTESIDPYAEILLLYNLTSPVGFQSVVLQELVHDFAEKIRCFESSQGTTSEECPYSFCIDTDSVLISLGHNTTSHILEKTFEDVAVALLGIADELNETCHTVINITERNVTSYSDKLSLRFQSDNLSGAFGVINIQETLESLLLEDVTSDYESESHGDNLLYREKCIGADVLFDQLGYDVESGPSSDSLGHVAALVVYHILSGSSVSRDCRVVPRDHFFLEEIYHSYGDNNNSVSHEAFGALLTALEIGGSQEVVSIVDGHDHRRKREADEYDGFLHKELWASTCYSEEELLAIFGIGESGIPVEKFAEVCPALVQQQLSGACAVATETVNDSVAALPSTAERYGYGTLATFIICMCSVVGAFVVKCTSDAAYEVIIAVFLGLATGTLYTDALLHLLPMALGAHGHEEDETAHEDSSGIVVEPYVWFSLAACAGVYVFYLFEKVLSMVRRQHGHSHGDQENIFPNTNMEITVEKYKEKQIEDEVEKKKTPVPSIAIMVCVADAIHNFADGIALGASFSSSLHLGISTSIAVVCHELPHELGDFAILIASGLSFTKALVLNVLVSLTAMVGLYVGLAISEDDAVRKWIVAVTAGIFLYISLVNMLPQLLQKSKGGTRDFVLNNIGILLGAGSMLLLAIFEEKIKI